MITGHLKRPICQNGGSITRSLHGHFKQLASDIDRGMSPLATFVQPWSAEERDEEAPSTARRQARVVSDLLPQE